MYANFGQGVFGGTRQYDHAIADAQTVLNAYPGRAIRFTGHSLGGGLASAAALTHNRRAVTFNAAGVHRSTADRSNAAQLIDAYRVEGDLLSTIQDALSPIGILAPNGTGRTYFLPGTSSDPISRHFMADVLAGMRQMGAQ